jgi:hypothetical protein
MFNYCELYPTEYHSKVIPIHFDQTANNIPKPNTKTIKR